MTGWQGQRRPVCLVDEGLYTCVVKRDGDGAEDSLAGARDLEGDRHRRGDPGPERRW